MKRWCSILLASAMVLSLAACGNGNSGNGTSDGGTAKQDNKKKELSVVFRDANGEGAEGKLWKWFTDAYETWELKDEWGLNVAPLEVSEGDYFAKVSLMLASESTAPDIVTEDTFQLPNDVAAGYLTDMSDYISTYDDWSLYYDSMKNGVSVQGKPYAIPYCTDTRGMFYNKDLFEQAGLDREWNPKSWDEVLDTLYILRDKLPDVVPLWLNAGTATGEATSMQTYEMLLYGTGSRLMDSAMEKWIVKDDNIIKSLGFIDEVFKNNLGPALSDVLDGQASNTGTDNLSQGKTAVYLQGSWNTGNYLEGGTYEWEGFEDVLGFAAMPTSDGQEPGTITLAGGWGLAIPQQSSNKDASWNLIQHMMKIDIYTPAIIAQGNITTRTDVAEREDYLAIPFMDVATDFLQNADFRPQNDLYSSVSTCIQEMVESVASGNATPEQAMGKYATDVARIVGDDNVIEQ